MRFSWDWIKELAGTDKDVKEAAEILSLKAFEVEDILDQDQGVALEIKVLANRPDCLSHLGVARELCALTGQRFSAPSYEYKQSEHPAVAIDIKDKEACPRYSGLVVHGVKIAASPKWLSERLELCGLKSINNVVDVTNYVMLELGQPMHAFDLKLIDRIIVRPAKDGEVLRALDEARTEYKLDPSILVIADGSKAVAIAGIKGGAGTGISDQTTDVLLEAANFDPRSIRATSVKLGLRTDASIRFAYGIDPNLTAAALARAAELMRQVSGGSPADSIIDVYPEPRQPETLSLDPAYVCALLGINIGNGQIRDILGSLGFQVADHGGKLNVTVPTRRLDITREEDLIEEVGRVYGYDAIPAVPPVLPIYDEKSWVREEDTENAWDEHEFIVERQGIARLLAGAGYSEVYNYVFLSDELKELLRLNDLLELAQPQSAEYRWLRTSLAPRLLVNARDNLRFTERIALFETGHIYERPGEKEPARLGLVLAAKADKEDQLFYELKGAVDLLMGKLGVTDYYFDDREKSFDEWDAGAVNATVKGQQALIRLEEGDAVIGFIGGVSGRVAGALKLKGVAAVAELDLRLLVQHAQHEREFEPLPKYPSVARDIAVLVDEDVKIDDILEVVQDAGGDIVQDVDVFDIFEPTGREKIKAEGDTPEYGKSVAFHVIYRSNDRTLTDKEVSETEDRIKKALQENLDAQVR